MLRETVDQVGDIPYQGNRNDQMGFGRLNILKAPQAAKLAPTTYTVKHQVLQPTPIHDFQSSALHVAVGDTGLIADIAIHLDIKHTYIGDFRVTIEPPSVYGFAPVLLHDKSGQG